MSQRSIPGSHDLGKTIKERRIELNLTIEEAASRAGVGIKHGAVMRRENPFAKIKPKAYARP